MLYLSLSPKKTFKPTYVKKTGFRAFPSVDFSKERQTIFTLPMEWRSLMLGSGRERDKDLF
jgi:hypothetical protein